jgi:hypothetical protein
MRVCLLLGLLLLGCAPASAQDPPVTFATVLPAGVADVSGWETVSGDFETAIVRGAYRFHVNPRRQAMYQVMRYKVELLGPSASQQRPRGSRERLAFVRSPGTREPIRCWEREPAGTIPPWRELAAGSDEYQVEMAMLMQVLAVHRAARANERR